MQDYRNYKLKHREMFILAIFSIAATLLGGFLFYNSLLGTLLAPIVFILLKKPIEEMLSNKRRIKIRDQFRDVLYSFSSSFADCLS